MLSTHCELNDWDNLSDDEYKKGKEAISRTLINLARRVYPKLGEAAVVHEVATPRTYQRYVHRPRGAVGVFA